MDEGFFLLRISGSMKNKILGSDMSGVVEAVGRNTTQFSIGDEVLADLYALGFGAYAQYVCVKESELSRKPKDVSFIDAASIPQAAICAYQGLQNREIGEGDEVLINGAGGGMGSFALQIAKSKGAKVTGVDREDKLELMRSLGADTVLDYNRTDYTQTGATYDYVLDMQANRRASKYKKALKQNGAYVIVGGKVSTILAVYIAGVRMKKSEGKSMSLFMWRPNDKSDISEILRMIEKGEVKPAVDAVYKFDDAIKAIEYCWEANAKGKVVLSMED